MRTWSASACREVENAREENALELRLDSRRREKRDILDLMLKD